MKSNFIEYANRVFPIANCIQFTDGIQIDDTENDCVFFVPTSEYKIIEQEILTYNFSYKEFCKRIQKKHNIHELINLEVNIEIDKFKRIKIDNISECNHIIQLNEHLPKTIIDLQDLIINTIIDNLELSFDKLYEIIKSTNECRIYIVNSDIENKIKGYILYEFNNALYHKFIFDATTKISQKYETIIKSLGV